MFITVGGNRIIDTVMSRSGNEKEVKAADNINKINKKKMTPSDVIDLLSFITELIKAIAAEFCNYARVKLCKMKLAIGCEDASTTALMYGAVSSALYTLIEFLDSVLNIKKNYKQIRIIPDFTSEECKVELKIVLKLKIIHLLLAFLHLLPALANAKKGK